MFLRLSVSHSVHGREVYTPWADTPRLGRDSPSRHPLGRHPPLETATAAEGTHPTGMHSCLQLHPYLTLLQTEHEHECSQH